MYYPYFRGKQYELITIRESADLFKASGFIPIIEPVKESLSGLKKTLDILEEVQAQSILIINPQCGDHYSGSNGIQSFIESELKKHKNISVGVILSEKTSIENINEICDQNKDREIVLLHFGFRDAKLLVDKVSNINKMRHIFLEECCGKLYQRNFKDPDYKVLLRDGFQRRINREHPELEFFSDLHITYEDEGVRRFSVPRKRYFIRQYLLPLGITSKYKPFSSLFLYDFFSGWNPLQAMSVRGMGASPS